MRTVNGEARSVALYALPTARNCALLFSVASVRSTAFVFHVFVRHEVVCVPNSEAGFWVAILISRFGKYITCFTPLIYHLLYPTLPTFLLFW